MLDSALQSVEPGFGPDCREQLCFGSGIDVVLKVSHARNCHRESPLLPSCSDAVRGNVHFVRNVAWGAVSRLVTPLAHPGASNASTDGKRSCDEARSN